jgi:hypothetical protein
MAKPITTNSANFREIERLYLEEKLSSSSISARLGGRVSIRTINRYITEIIHRCADKGFLVPDRRNPAGGTPNSAAKVLSSQHHSVGLRILQHRLGGNDNLSPKEYSLKYELGNQNSIPRMECGKYDFTMSELIHISEVIGLSIPELLMPLWRKKEEAA